MMKRSQIPLITAKKPGKTHVFKLPLIGPKGGVHWVKYRMDLLAGCRGATRGEGGIIDLEAAQRAQERGKNQGYITRVVEWQKPTAWGGTQTVGFLIYGIKFDVVETAAEAKNRIFPGMQFWFGEE